MACKSCGTAGQGEFPTEVAIHVPDIKSPLVFVFPSIFVCLNCGKPEFAEEFTIPENELHLLINRDAAGQNEIAIREQETNQDTRYRVQAF